METYPIKFTEIIGGRLLGIGTTNSSYIALNSNDSQRNIDSPNLEFDNGLLTIENPFILKNDTSNINSTDSLMNTELIKLIGKCVVDATYEIDTIVIKFETGASIIISLRDTDYNSPEAGNFSPIVGPIIVFN